jgi:hypothetical protein
MVSGTDTAILLNEFSARLNVAYFDLIVLAAPAAKAEKDAAHLSEQFDIAFKKHQAAEAEFHKLDSSDDSQRALKAHLRELTLDHARLVNICREGYNKKKQEKISHSLAYAKAAKVQLEVFSGLRVELLAAIRREMGQSTDVDKFKESENFRVSNISAARQKFLDAASA